MRGGSTRKEKKRKRKFFFFFRFFLVFSPFYRKKTHASFLPPPSTSPPLPLFRKGFAAAAGALIVGPRIGRFLPDGTVVSMPGHNSSLFILGVMILWFGWYGFNPGSQQAISGATNYLAVANAAVTTTLAPAAAGLSALIIGAIESKVATGKAMYGVENMGNGCLAGLAAITASCNVVRPWAAIIIGAVSGALYLFASKVSVKIKLDDPLDAVAVHAWNGLWGILAAGLFSDVTLVGNSYATNDPAGVPFPRGGGLFYSGGPGRGRQLAAQVVYAIWVAGWVLANMVSFFFPLGWKKKKVVSGERERKKNREKNKNQLFPPKKKKTLSLPDPLLAHPQGHRPPPRPLRRGDRRPRPLLPRRLGLPWRPRGGRGQVAQGARADGARHRVAQVGARRAQGRGLQGRGVKVFPAGRGTGGAPLPSAPPPGRGSGPRGGTDRPGGAGRAFLAAFCLSGVCV